MTDLHLDVGTARLAVTDLSAEGDFVGSVVALHAGVADRRSWAPVAAAWAGRGWRVVTYDRRGFGDSEWEAAPHDHVADLVAVLDDRGIDRAVLVGSSSGGAVAIDAALAHPERVRALVLVGSAVSGQAELLGEMTAAERTLDAAIEEAEASGDVDQVNELECRYWLDGPGAPHPRVQGAARTLFLEMNGRALRAPAVGDRRAHPPSWDRLGTLDVPTAVMIGDLDDSDVAAVARKIADEVPGATLTELPGSAHLPMLDAAERFEAVTTAVLDRLR